MVIISQLKQQVRQRSAPKGTFATEVTNTPVLQGATEMQIDCRVRLVLDPVRQDSTADRPQHHRGRVAVPLRGMIIRKITIVFAALGDSVLDRVAGARPRQMILVFALESQSATRRKSTAQTENAQNFLRSTRARTKTGTRR